MTTTSTEAEVATTFAEAEAAPCCPDVKASRFGAGEHLFHLPDGTVLTGGRITSFGERKPETWLTDSFYFGIFNEQLAESGYVKVTAEWNIPEPGLIIEGRNLEDLFVPDGSLLALRGCDKANAAGTSRHTMFIFGPAPNTACSPFVRPEGEPLSVYDAATDPIYTLGRVDHFKSEQDFLRVYGVETL